MEPTVRAEGTLGDRTDNRNATYQAALKSPIVRQALISIVAYLLLLALIGIIYKDELSWSRRWAYLLVCALLCVPICIFYGVLADHVSRLHSRAVGMVSLAGSALLSAGSATVLVYGVDRLFRVGFMPNRMRDPYVLALVVLLVFASVVQFAMVRRESVEPTVPQVEEAASGQEPKAGEGPARGLEGWREALGAQFFKRLPASLGRDVLYLKMSDHYVEVFTTAGHTVLLMRFADAMAELEGLGMRVHRSYWVGNNHSERLVRRGRRRFLRLTGGHDVPVSRTYLASVEAALEANTRTS